MAVIDTSGLTKHFGQVRALQDLDLTVEAGEVFGFLGPNGAGKTTTIRLLMGFLRATDGRARVLDGDAFADSVAIHQRVGYLPSDPVYPRALTGREYLEHLARLRGGVDRDRLAELVDLFDVELRPQMDRLSRGNRQKIGVVQAFMHDPELVILDEPSSGLDPLKQAALEGLVRQTADDGRTVFLSSHVISEVEQVADRVGIIRGGVVVALETIEALRERALRRARIRFAGPVDPAPFARLPGVHDIAAHGDTLLMTLAGPMDQLVKTAAGHEVLTFTSDDADLSEVFLSYYTNGRP